MAVRMEKAWIPLSIDNVDKLTAHLGVYQLANEGGEIVYIGISVWRVGAHYSG